MRCPSCNNAPREKGAGDMTLPVWNGGCGGSLSYLSAQIAPAVQAAPASGKEIVAYAIRKGYLLVAMVLVAALTHRFLAAPIAATPAKAVLR